MDDFSFRVWEEDCTGLILRKGTQKKKGGCLCPTTQLMYRYQEALSIPRDAASRFYDNPYLHMVGVQRVVVIDQDAGEVMICTPARAAAWMVLRNRGIKDAVVTEVNALEDITQEELDQTNDGRQSLDGGDSRPHLIPQRANHVGKGQV